MTVVAWGVCLTPYDWKGLNYEQLCRAMEKP